MRFGIIANGNALLLVLALGQGGCLFEMTGIASDPDATSDTVFHDTLEGDTAVDTSADLATEDSTVDLIDDDPTADDPPGPETEDVPEDPGSDLPPCDGPLVLYYIDGDGDGFGSIDAGFESCVQPPGYADNHDDCWDYNADAHPGQVNYFPIERGDGSYDYDCNGSWDLYLTATTSCAAFVCDEAGWTGAVPGCSATGTWRVCTWTWLWCDEGEAPRQQLCR